MPVRPAIVASVLGCLAAASAASPTSTAAAQGRFEYPASSAQYRFTSSAKAAQTAMGQTNNVESSNMRLLTITLARSAPDTITMTIVLDSINIVGAMGMVPPGVDKLPGTRFVAKVAPWGAMYSVTGPSEAESPLGAQLTPDLGRMLPVIKAPLAAGAVWADTLKDTPKQMGMELERVIISSFRVVGDSMVDGERAWKVERETSTSAKGSGSPQGQPITVEATGAGKGTLLFAHSGLLLGGQNEDQTTGKIVATMSGMELGVVTTTTTRVVKVR